LGRRKPNGSSHPGQGHAQLVELEPADTWGRWDAGEPCAIREEAGDERRQLGLAGSCLLRRGTALQGKARRPRDQVDVPIPNAGEVPVDQKRPLAEKTEVVAAHIEVNEVGATEHSRLFGFDQYRECPLQPRGRADAQSQKGLPIVLNACPTRQTIAPLLQAGKPIRRNGPPDPVEHSLDTLHSMERPGRRPLTFTQILEQQDRCRFVIVPSQTAGDEVGPKLRVHAVLISEPLCGVLSRGHLGENARTIPQAGDPSLRRRIPTSGDTPPGDRLRSNQRRHSLDGARRRLPDVHCAQGTEHE
jgi:hypothetical protein